VQVLPIGGGGGGGRQADLHQVKRESWRKGTSISIAIEVFPERDFLTNSRGENLSVIKEKKQAWGRKKGFFVSSYLCSLAREEGRKFLRLLPISISSGSCH